MLAHVKGLLWRVACKLIASVFLAVVGSDAYSIFVQGGTLAYSVGVLHAFFFLAVGAIVLAIAILADPLLLRDLVVDFARGITSRRNLKGFTRDFAVIVLIALAWVLIEMRWRP